MAATQSSTEVKPKGIKRPPTDDLENDQRLAKRFNLLNLDNDSKLYIPIQSSSASKPPQDASDSDFMELEDTKHKVYIYDLDKELAESESDDERPIFIPDIEKHLVKIPKSILIGDDTKKAAKNMQMILYSVPSSLTVAKEKDSVRKVIIEARQRAREKHAITTPPAPETVFAHSELNGGTSTPPNPLAIDSEPEVMDMD